MANKPLTMGDLFKGVSKSIIRGLDTASMPEDVAPLAQTLKEQILEATKEETPTEKQPADIETEGETLEESKL